MRLARARHSATPPALSGFVLASPTRGSKSTTATGRIAENDNWDTALISTLTQVGAFALPAGSKDSALLLTLTAGNSYTAQVSGVGGTTGEALVEVYEVP